MASLIKPKLLKPGDLVIIVAPSGLVTDEYIYKATEVFESWGLRVKYGENLFATQHQFAGTDEQRLYDIQEALDDDEISAVFCARGGYGLIRILDKISLSRFTKNPKWVVGFSDITVLHSLLFKAGFQSIHGIMPVNFSDLPLSAKPIEMLGQVLFEGNIEFEIPWNNLNRPGTEKAFVTGGNLSLLYALQGTPYEVDTKNRILFLEDVGEQLYHIDRILQSFRLAGKFDRLNGLIIGSFSEMEDKKRPFGKTAEEIISDITEGYDFPLVFNFPSGHIRENLPVILGSETTMNISAALAKIRFE